MQIHALRKCRFLLLGSNNVSLVPKPQGTFQWIDNFGKPVQTFLNWVESIDRAIRFGNMTGAIVIAGLPAAGLAGAGARQFVTDSNATLAAGLGNIVAAGGGNNVPVYSDGTNWRIG